MEHLPTRLDEFLLDHEGLANATRDWRMDVPSNDLFFVVDLARGHLEAFVGSYVAYHKGCLVGRSPVQERLTEVAGRYFGASSLSVFYVPGEDEVSAQHLLRG